MINPIDKTVLDDVESPDFGAMLDCETLKAKTYPKDRDEMVVREVPDVSDEPDILGYIWRARARADYKGIEVIEERKKCVGIQGIVLDNVYAGTRDCSLA